MLSDTLDEHGGAGLVDEALGVQVVGSGEHDAPLAPNGLGPAVVDGCWLRERRFPPAFSGKAGWRLRSWGMANLYWPLFDLRVTTPRLEIRLPTDDELYELLAVVDAGIHDRATMPFLVAWTDVPAPGRHRESLQWWWSQRAHWKPEDWSFTGAVFVDGSPVGVQDVAAHDFATIRAVTTGSWLGRSYQGQGLGKEMREAILHLAFDGLGALEAHTAAFPDNEPSLAVTRSLGYADNGHEVVMRRGERARYLRFCLDSATWSARRRSDISISGLESCREMFGLGS